MKAFSDPLWVVTSYYNPAGYKRRLDNFRAFRRNLTAPLLVVELAREGRHQLSADDADIVISLTGEDRIWQKERLINIGVHELPPHVEFVAWADCDLLFEDEGWPAEATRRLERQGGLLQPFETAVYLPETIDPTHVKLGQCLETRPLLTAISSVAAARTSLFDDNESRLVATRANYDDNRYYLLLDQYNCYGMAWAARRAQFESCGLYDGNVIGGGDAVKTFAALGKMGHYWNTRPHTPRMRDYAEAWIQRAEAVGFLHTPDNLAQRIFHLWHGDITDRDYRGRHNVLVRQDFDPTRDVAFADNRTWRWTNPDSELARAVGAYFFSRREDGAI